MPVSYRGETRELNDATRRQLSGHFTQLTDGVTHYELGGPENGSPVVFVHGFSVPCFIFDPTFTALAGAGFRVLRYDLFGRGWSDRPDVDYGIDLFVRQLSELIEVLQISGPVSLIGLSMGGPISASFMADNPRRVQKLVLIDPAGAKPIHFPILLKLVAAPGVGEMAFGLLSPEILLKTMAADFFDPALVAQFQAKYRLQTEYKGFLRALLSTLRHNMLGSFIDAYRRAGRLGIPTLLIWGHDDKTTPFEYNLEIRAAIPHADFHAIEGCGHIPHYERPAAVNKLLSDFLKG